MVNRIANDEVNVLALVKGEEHYVFLYDDASRAEVLRMLGRYASNTELSFTWYDAALLSQWIRQGSVMEPEIVRYGLLDMQVCVPCDWTDDQIEQFSDQQNPSGIHSWKIRADEKRLDGYPKRNPCDDRGGFVHVVLDC